MQEETLVEDRSAGAADWRGHLSSRLSPTPALARQAPSRVPAPNLPAQATPLIGREREVAALIEVGVRVARVGRPAAALVMGDPGSGKSRLLAEACARRTAIRRQLRIVGFEPARQVPLAAASDVLRALTVAPRDGQRLRALLYDSRVRQPGGAWRAGALAHLRGGAPGAPRFRAPADHRRRSPVG